MTEYAVVSDSGIYSNREEAEAARRAVLDKDGHHLADFVHVVEVRAIPLTPEEEAHAINEAREEREALSWSRQREIDAAQRFQL